MAQTMGDEEAPFLESPSEMYPESPNQAARLERESNLGWSLGRLHSVMSLNTLEAINSYKGLNEDQEMNSEPPPPAIIDLTGLEDPIFRHVEFPTNAHVIEIGCGAGAQSKSLLALDPSLSLTSVDPSPPVIEMASKDSQLADMASMGRLRLTIAPLTSLPTVAGGYDGGFICWVLEHKTAQTANILHDARRVIKPGGLLFVTEVFNASLYFYPPSPSTIHFLQAYNAYRRSCGGDPNIGIRLGTTLAHAGFKQIEIRTLSTHLDGREPARKKAVIEYWLSLMTEPCRDMLNRGMISKEIVEGMARECRFVASSPEGVFYYAAFQACAVCPEWTKSSQDT
eukprot:TRINITY_DN33349_c0_g1_i1.p1 TRINITY_DN33349_c0_g1~~TRINITY_DN33349_c0_g1_i1.p1  ORF type:complete len:340 (+),score=55.68 TRINITY_DN33349_c0_g1_i1:172-1191(+)